ncbi:hypothetical protein VP01_4760g2 [Puccinia sorghi]|uniref:Uncharacterized protein n=1 Tax=Puccinia sorghi TaxID=27349 RepID=A0A0L6UPQ4_9BASI|nr:hypothetical protein VP01_4760g2 [Puccinia sorghi]
MSVYTLLPPPGALIHLQSTIRISRLFHAGDCAANWNLFQHLFKQSPRGEFCGISSVKPDQVTYVPFVRTYLLLFSVSQLTHNENKKIKKIGINIMVHEVTIMKLVHDLRTVWHIQGKYMDAQRFTLNRIACSVNTTSLSFSLLEYIPCCMTTTSLSQQQQLALSTNSQSIGLFQLDYSSSIIYGLHSPTLTWSGNCLCVSIFISSFHCSLKLFIKGQEIPNFCYPKIQGQQVPFSVFQQLLQREFTQDMMIQLLPPTPHHNNHYLIIPPSEINEHDIKCPTHQEANNFCPCMSTPLTLGVEPVIHIIYYHLTLIVYLFNLHMCSANAIKDNKTWPSWRQLPPWLLFNPAACPWGHHQLVFLRFERLSSRYIHVAYFERL